MNMRCSEVRWWLNLSLLQRGNSHHPKYPSLPFGFLIFRVGWGGGVYKSRLSLLPFRPEKKGGVFILFRITPCLGCSFEQKRIEGKKRASFSCAIFGDCVKNSNYMWSTEYKEGFFSQSEGSTLFKNKRKAKLCFSSFENCRAAKNYSLRPEIGRRAEREICQNQTADFFRNL